jgi:Fic family protein
LNGDNVGNIANQDHRNWYRELFIPLVNAGIQNAGSLAGYRSDRVLIKGSRHIPASGDAVPDLMPVFFELLEHEEDPGTRVVLGHFAFVYIHPYADGNGRIARFLMNLMLASGGFPWTIIPVDHRQKYMECLESASVEQNIKPFAEFLGRLTQSQMAGDDLATLPPDKR